jgi:hypothetical protein
MIKEFKTSQKIIRCNSKDVFHINIFGDLHSDTEGFDEDRFHDYLKRTLSYENPLYIGMGDYNDLASCSESAKIKAAQLHETTIDAFDKLAQNSNIKTAKLLMPMKGKLLGLISGNHVWQFSNGKYSDEDLAERLHTESLGYLCAYMLKFNLTDRGTRRGENSAGTTISVPMFLCHGKGGGWLLGSSINKVAQMAEIIPNCLIYAQGHDHQLSATPSTSIMLKDHMGKLFLKECKRYFVRSGSFLKAYVPNTSNYATSGLMKPSTLGGVTIRVSFKRTKDVYNVELNAIL